MKAAFDFPLAHGKRLAHLVVYVLLATLCMLIYQLLSNISDPTKAAFIVDDQSQPLSISTAYYLDKESSMDYQSIMADPQLFVPKIDHLPWSFEQQTYWLWIKLDNQSEHIQSLVLHLDNLMLEQLDIVQLDEHNQPMNSERLGWQAERLTRAQRSMPNYAFTLAQGQQTQFIIRIQTEGIAKTPINIYQQSDFNQLAQFIFLIWGIFSGILIMTALYNLVLFIGLKDPIYLVYIGYILSILMMYGVVIGFGHYIWPEAIVRIIREHIVSANVLALIFTVSFAVLFFNAQHSKSKVVTFAFYYLVGLVILAIVSWWLPEYIAAPLFFIAMAIMYPLAFVLIGKQLASDFSWAKLYVLSWIPLILGGSVQPMELTGVLPYTFFIHHALMIGVLIEIVLMAIALADRMRHKKELALYDATHHLETLLPNRNLFEHALQANNDSNLAICLIEIIEFHTLLPYINNSDNNDITIMMATNIERHVHNKDEFINIDAKGDQPIKLAKIREGVFGLLYKFSSKNKKDNLNQKLLALQHGVAKGVHINDLFINLTTRVGVSLSLQENKLNSLNEMMKQAFQALEQGKITKSSISFYQQEDALNIAKRLALAADLQQALNNNKLELFHQPQVNLEDNSIDGSEALLRWQHDKLGPIAPDIFIELAEDTGIINELTLWVIDTACQQLTQLIEHGFNQHNISINISGKDIAEAHFLTNVKSILNNYSFPLERLTFELTESVMVNDFHHLSQTMKELSNIGVKVSIDDYGTGYSSLVYISQLPFNELKIDKSFIIPLAQSKRNKTIVQTTIDMAKNLDLKVVAEGVETKEIESQLKDHQCHIAQGYFYSKPLNFDHYLLWLKNRLP